MAFTTEFDIQKCSIYWTGPLILKGHRLKFPNFVPGNYYDNYLSEYVVKPLNDYCNSRNFREDFIFAKLRKCEVSRK